MLLGKFELFSKAAKIKWLMLMAGMMMSLNLLDACADNSTQTPNSNQVMEAFDRQQVEKVGADTVVTDKKKQIIMFALGVPLLILLLTTGALGIAMALFGKQVFVMHMVFAGLTVTLALVHVIVGLVWFYPF
jgi:hypothetical protein